MKKYIESDRKCSFETQFNKELHRNSIKKPCPGKKIPKIWKYDTKKAICRNLNGLIKWVTKIIQNLKVKTVTNVENYKYVLSYSLINTQFFEIIHKYENHSYRFSIDTWFDQVKLFGSILETQQFNLMTEIHLRHLIRDDLKDLCGLNNVHTRLALQPVC